MKKLLIASFLACFALTSFGQNIALSAHDLRSDYNITSDEICIVCHTPHGADATVAEAPLWNHELSAVASYGVYSSLTLTATDVAQPSASSKLCLSCHDGTVAVGSFGGNTGSGSVTGGDLIGQDLNVHHPISFGYNTALATLDGGLHNPSVALSGVGVSVGTIADDMLFGGEMECASCHDVHNAYSIPNLLVKTNSASALCLTCHDK